MDKKTTFTVDKENLEVRMTRIFNAPRELVFKAYSDPTLIKKWWGPKIYKNTIDKFDFRVGGEWRFIQTDDKGEEFVFYGIYKEIVVPEKITDTFNYEPIGLGHELVETVILEDMNGKTMLTAISKYASIEDLEGMVASGMEGGATESMENLAQLVEK